MTPSWIAGIAVIIVLVVVAVVVFRGDNSI